MKPKKPAYEVLAEGWWCPLFREVKRYSCEHEVGRLGSFKVLVIKKLRLNKKGKP